MNKTVIPVLNSRIPEYVRENYPHFVDYLKDYLSWLEQDGNFLRILEDWDYNNEPSNLVEPYVDAMLRDFGFDVGEVLAVKKDVLAHLLRDFYLTRGTEGSFRFLFRALFNADVTIRYPREEMLVPSAAYYGKRYFIFTSANNRFSNKFSDIQKSVTTLGGEIFGVSSKTVASIEAISIVYAQGTPLLRIEILEPLSDFIVDEQVNIIVGQNVISEQLQPILEMGIEHGGSDYREGDTVEIVGAGLSGTARVGSTLKGGISAVNIVSGGSGYQIGDVVTTLNTSSSGFSAKVASVDGSGKIVKVHISNSGYNFSAIPDLTVKSVSGTGAVLTGVSTNIGTIRNVKFQSPYVAFDNLTVTVISDKGQGATFLPVKVAIWETSEWTTNLGFIGEASTLIDSDKYQQFSYTLVSQVPGSQYDPYVDKLLHPSGYIRSNSFEITSNIKLSIFGDESESAGDIYYEFEAYLNLHPVADMELITDSGENVIVTGDGEIIVTGSGEPIIYA